MKIISISGLDGSGKSTQIGILKNYLESQDKKVFYFHAIQFGIAQKINSLKQKYCLLCRIIKKCKVSKTEESVTRSGILGIILRRIFLMIDLMRFKKLLKKLEKERFDYLVSDRYFYDSIINIRYLAKSETKLPCEKFILKPDLSIYLNATPEIIMQREKKPDQGIDYLKKKKELYDNMALIWNLKIIDGNRAKEEIFENIKNII